MSLTKKALLSSLALILLVSLALAWVALAAPLAPDTDLAEADAIFLGENTINRAGNAVTGLGDINGDGLPDFAIAAPLNSETDTSAGQIYIFFGNAAGWDATVSLSSADASFLGERGGSWAGGSVAAAGDVNNDTFDDILIGAPQDDEGGDGAGQVYLILGKASGWAMDTSLSTADASFWGEAAGDNAGTSVAGVGDVNKDTFDDFLVGAPKNDQTGNSVGQSYLILGKASGWATDTSLSAADASFYGENAQAQSGYSVAGAGDVNKDGFADLLIGAWLQNTSFPNAGEAYLIFGKASGWTMRTSLASSNASYVGEHLGYWAGTSVAGAGDVNGDGYADFLVGAPGNDDRGRQTGEAYLVLGKATGWAMRTFLNTVDASFRSEWEDSWAGQTVSPAGDINKDGLADFLVAAVRSDDGGTDSGAIYLVLGKTSGWAQDTELLTAIASFQGEEVRDYAGTSMAAVGDVNGDGWDDLLIGAPQNDADGEDAGRAYLLLGNNAPTTGNFTADTPFDAIENYHTFSASYYDLVDGWKELDTVYLYAASSNAQLAVRYVRASQNLYLQENGGTWLGPCKRGQAGTLTGTYYELDCLNTTAVSDGLAKVTIGWRLRLLQSISAAETISFELRALDLGGHDSGRQAGGSWEVTPDPKEDDLSQAADSFLGVSDKDNAGWSVAFAGDVNDDGFGDLLISAPNNGQVSYNGGKVYLFLGKAIGWGQDLSLASADASFLAEGDFDYAGYSVAGVGDVNNDGFDDFVIGAYSNDEAGTTGGQTYLILGKATGWAQDTSLSAVDASFLAEDGSDFAGYAVAGAGDVNNDGFDDFIIGAWGDEKGGGNQTGVAYLILGKATGWAQDTSLSTADASFLGEHADNWAGYSLAGAGDVNGDGFDDFLIGAPMNADNGTAAGKAYLVLGKASGWAIDTPLAEVDASFRGMDGGDMAGLALAGIGDVNNDGYSDFVICAPGDEDGGGLEAGQVYIFFGNVNGWAQNIPLSNADASFLGEKPHDFAGRSASALGDLNNDGFPEFAIAAPRNDDGGFMAGKVYVLWGKASNWKMGISLVDTPAAYWGELPGDRAGFSIAGAYNVSGDGRISLLIGAPGNDQGSNYDAGKIYQVYPQVDPLSSTAPWPTFHQNPKHTGQSDYIGPQQGDLLWTFTTSDTIQTSPAIAADGTIYIGSDDGKLYAINPDGSQKWVYTAGGAIASSPTIDEAGTIYFGSDDNYVYAVKPTGSIKWKTLTGGDVRSTPATGINGFIYVGSDDFNLYSLRPDNGMPYWNLTTEGEIKASPAIGSDGTIYVGSYDGRVYAVNSDKTLRWVYAVEHEGIDSSPAVGSDGTVYTGASDGRLYAIDTVGDLKWKYYTDGRMTSSPAIGEDGTIYVGSNDSRLYAFNPDGTLQWSYLTGNLVRSSPAIGDDGTIYVGADDGNMYVFDRDGNLLWQYDIGSPIGSSPAIGADGTLYIGADDGVLYAIGVPGVYFSSASTSQEGEPGQRLTYTLWTHNLTGDKDTFDLSVSGNNWLTSVSPASPFLISSGKGISLTVQVDIPVTASPAESDTATLLVSTQGQTYTQTATLVSQVSQTIRPWPMFGHDRQHLSRSSFAGPTQAVQRWAFTTTGAVLSSPTIASDGTAYFGSDDGNLYAVNPDGSLKWSYLTGGALRSSPAIGFDEMIYVGSTDNSLYAINSGGAFEWSYPTGNQIVSSPSIGPEGTIYIGSTDGKTYALDPTGELIWSFETGGAIYASPALEPGGVVYIGSDDGNLYAIGSDGLPDWQFPAGGAIRSSATIAEDGTIYVGSSDHFLYAIRPDGAEEWSYETDGEVDSSPALGSDGTIYITVKGEATRLFAIHPDGTLYWIYPPTCFPPASVTIAGPTSGRTRATYEFTATVPLTTSTPLSYTWEATGQTTVINSSDWVDTISFTWNTPGDQTIQVTAANQCGQASDDHSIETEVVMLLPLIFNGCGQSCASAIVPGDLTIPSVIPDGGQGAQPSAQPAADGVVLATSPVVGVNGTIYTTLDDGTLYALHPDGWLNWSFPLHGTLASSAAIGADGDVYIGSDDGNLYSVGLVNMALTPANQHYWNQPGESVTYTLSLQNLTGPAESFSLDLENNTWPGTLSVDDTPTLQPGETFTFTVRVDIPVGAVAGQMDSATLVATSIQWPSASITATLQSHVEIGWGPWPMYHHDRSNTGVSPYTGPQDNTVDWSILFSPGIYSSPAVALDGTIYVGSNDGNLYAVNLDGSIRWAHYLRGYVQSSPAISPGVGTVYVGSDDGNLYALDPQTGEVVWTFQTGDSIKSSPTIASDDAIYFGSDDGFLYALEHNGSLRWAYAVGAAIRSTPAIGEDGSIYFGAQDSNLYALHADGTLNWTYLASGRVDSAPAIGPDGNIYFGAEEGMANGNFYALYPDGTPVWSTPFDPGQVVYTTPAFAADGTIYLGAHNGNVYALHPDGSVYWTYTTTTDAWVRSAPVVGADGTVYIGSWDRTMYALYPDGSLKWEYYVGGQIEASFAIGADGRLFVTTTDGDLYAFGP